jgi:tRNA(Ser,Leu) C12 N-acetylase TAN1
MDLLVSYPWGRFQRARREIISTLEQLGDDSPTVRRTSVDGIAVVHTVLGNRDVVRGCSELFDAEPGPEFAVKWVPVDYWCETDLEAIKAVIEEKVAGQIAENETWGMKVEKRRWQRYHKAQIIEYLAPSIARKVNLNNPDKLLRLDVVGRKTAISLLRPGEIFSMGT